MLAEPEKFHPDHGGVSIDSCRPESSVNDLCEVVHTRFAGSTPSPMPPPTALSNAECVLSSGALLYDFAE